MKVRRIPSFWLVLALALTACSVVRAHDSVAEHGDAARALIRTWASRPDASKEERSELEEAIVRNLLATGAEPAHASPGRPGPPGWFTDPVVLAAARGRNTGTSRGQIVVKRPKTLVTAAAPAVTLSAARVTETPLLSAFVAPAGYGSLMAASFAPFKPKLRYYWDASTFYVESDNMPDNMPNRMVGITAWQQQIPLPIAYFASVTNPENSTGSLGYGQPNYWRLPLVPTVAPTPIQIFTPGSTNNNFQRGAVALASNGVAIFNPANNRGEVSYEIGELDYYGGHCGLADDYHYHIIPMHLSSRFGGPLSDDKPIAWALDGYPIYGYVEPDGGARQALDASGGHDIGNGWGYHYHAIGNNNVDATHPYGTPQSPYTMTSFRGSVVNFGGQVDGQPEVGSIRASGTGGYTAQVVAGASFGANAYKNPVALTTDGSGNLIEDTSPGAIASADNYRLRVTISGTNYDECWRINRNANPKTLTITWRLPSGTTTTTYTPNVNSQAASGRLLAYPLAAWSQQKLPDTGQTLDGTATFGEDSDYTINPPALTDNGDGTISDTVTGLMWQKTDAGESTWGNAVTNAASQTTGGYTDWRLPTPAELFSIMNHNNNPGIDLTKFPNHPNGAAEYWWSSDIFGSDATKVWCTNSGGGLGPKPISETLSAGGAFRYHARYVRGGKPSNGHNYTNNGDGTITDTDTALMWTQLPAAAMNWNAALTYAENLTLGGYSDWRLPTIKELQTLTDYTLATASSATGVKPCVNRTLFGRTLTSCTTTAAGTTITCADTSGLLPGMVLVDIASAGGAYLPTATPPVVQAVTSATAFTVTSGTGINAGSGLTLRALVPPTAYWSSTVQRSGTLTSAWLLELGVNNSVPAANGPPRGAQGIISYEVFASSYPVFAVRSTSVTTQIAVAQGANTLTDGVSTVGFTGSSSKTFTITNTGVTSLTLNGVTLDGTHAARFSVSGAPASGTVLAPNATTSFTVSFAATAAATYSAALHIASSDTGVGTAFDVNLTGTIPVIASVTTNPGVPSTGDSPYITARITPTTGTTVSQVQLTYSYGTQTTATAFREVFAQGSTTSGLAGSINAWSATAVRAAADVKQRGSTGNNTAPVVLTNCTTNGTTAVTCASTTGLWPGMAITGTNIAANTTIAQVTSATAITLSTAASGSGTGLSLTAAGVSLTGCSLATSPTVNTASTTGLAEGMGISGSGLTTNPPNPTVARIGSATQFNLSSTTVTAVPATLTASGTGAEFSSGTTNFTDTMFATTNPINASGSVFTSGSTTTNFVEFYVRTSDLISNNGWQLQIAPDGTNYTTRLTETFASSSATNCTLNSSNDQTSGSTTVLCANTSGLTSGNTVQGNAVSLTAGITQNSTTITCTNTTGLFVGMFITGTNTAGVPANTRVTAITPNTSFTVNNAPTGTTGSYTLLANYFAANTTISSIVSNTSFTVNNAAFYSGSGVTVSTVNHGFKKMHYDLQSGDLTATMKMRFQFSGYSPAGGGTNPARPPTCDIDDIIVVLTTGVAPVTVTMFDDGLHGDGAAGDGVYGVQLPSFAAGTTITYSIAMTDSSSTVTTLASAGSYTVTQPLSINTASPLPGGLTSAPYTQVLTAANGSGAGYTWSVTAGSLPPGVTLGSNGAFSGTPTTAGTYNFTATVTDSANRTVSKTFALTVKVPPNIVIIVTDDQGWADVGYHTASGQVQIQTPTMDSFGTTRSGSIRLERFYATTVCSVTRSTLLTGRNALRHGTTNERGLDLSEHIMPQTFNAAGYQSYMVGKWHLGGSDKNESFTTVNGVTTRVIQEGTEYAPYNRGWLSHYGQYSGAIDYFTHRSAEPLSQDIPDWWLNGVQVDGPGEHTDSQGHGGWSPDLLADKAVSHIQNRDPNKPLLLYVAFNSIHGPVSAPPDLLAKYASISDVSRRTIAAAVDGMDAAMGRVLNALDTAGITNNTLVVWFSDNGGDTTKGSLNLPLRGTKGDSYEGGMHMPAGIRWPGVLPSNVTSNQYFWVGDIFPTLCAAAGVTPQNSPSKPFDGVNLWPALLSANSSTTTTTRGSPLVTVSDTPIAIDQFTDPVNGGTKDFKLIRNHVGTTFPVELYNLTDDPQETTDLSANGAYASIVSTLTSAITAIAPIDYPPYIGPALITNSVPQGGTIELYAPFKSYKAPTVRWRKNGVNLTDGGTISGATSATQVKDPTNATVTGAYTTKLTITGATLSDAGTYDVIVSNVGGTTTSTAGTLTVAVGAPVLTTLPTFTNGTSQSIAWAAVPTATGYTVQASTSSTFSSTLATQNVTASPATFIGLSGGTTYYFRATATDGTTTSVFSNTVSTTKDTVNPAIAITSPANGFISTQGTVNVQGTAGDGLSGVAWVSVDGVAATTADSFAHWSATVPLSVGTNTLTATATDVAGNTSITSVLGNFTPAVPVISNVATGPTAPTYLDPVYVTAQVQAGAGAVLSQVQLLYDIGTPISSPVFREVFSNTAANPWPSGASSTNLGALNQWLTPGATTVRQAIAQSNNTTPIVLTNCTTNGTTTVTCASTANLWPGMLVTGPNIPGNSTGSATGNTTVTGVSADGVTFTISQAASGSGSSLTLTAAGVTLTNCTTVAGTAVTCTSTAGLINGMALTGTGLANNATVASVTDATHFTMNVAPTTPGSSLTLTAAGAGLEFQNTSATTVTVETASGISLAGAASGYVEFYVQTRDLAATSNNSWAFAVMNTSGTWNTRLGEDWNGKTVSLTNVVANSAGSTTGSTSVTCADTSALTTGRSLVGPTVYVSGTASPSSAVVTGTNTTNLLVGMFLAGNTGIPNGARILTIDSATQFTMTVNSTVTSAQSVNFAATWFAGNTTVSSITNATTFVVNTPIYTNTSAAPISASATTLNHGFTKYRYDLDPSTEVNGSIKLRFSATGYSPTQPTRVPRVNVDDIVVVKTTAPPTVTLAMYDDGLHGDGAAGDGTYGAQIPVQNSGTAVAYRVRATDSNAASTTSGSASFTVNPYLTDSTIVNAEFLTIPTDTGVTLTVGMATDQEAYVQYGTAPGSYTNSTTPATFAAANGPVRIALSGLQPDTKYTYRLRHRAAGSTGAFAARGERSFRTARPRGASFVFTVTADPHLDFNTDPTLLTRAMANLAVDQPDFHIDLGDIFMTDKMADTVAGVPAQYGGGPISQSSVNLRASIFRNFFELACHSVPYFYTLGNHEAEYGYLFNAATDKQNNIPAWNLKARKAYYPAPTPNAFYTGNGTPKDYTGGSLGLLEDYYAWEWGDALFIVLDPFWNTTTNPNQVNDAWQWTLGKVQYDWLKATLQNSSARYKFVFMHHIVGGTPTLADGVTTNVAARGGVEVAGYYEWGGRNADGSDGFASRRSGWDLPIHNLLVANKVNAVFHGHDHLYGYQTLDGIVYLECPQPGTANYTQLGSAPDGKYTQGVLLPNSGHIRVSVSPGQTLAEYVRAYRSSDENATTRNRDVSHSFTMAPRLFPPTEVSAKTSSALTFRWNAVPNKAYSVQWSPDLVTWTTIDTVVFPAANTNGTYTDTNTARLNGSKGYYRVSFTP